MTDRELLEAAARAAGLVVLRSRLDDPMWRDMLLDMRPAFPQTYGWNPLTDDGDALRLAVKLGIGLRHHIGWGQVFSPQAGIEDFRYEGDPCAATRRAIVRAAAAMGTEGHNDEAQRRPAGQ